MMHGTEREDPERILDQNGLDRETRNGQGRPDRNPDRTGPRDTERTGLAGPERTGPGQIGLDRPDRNGRPKSFWPYLDTHGLPEALDRTM